MGTEKVEKKLPDEILAIIDAESMNSGISRHEALSRLIHSVTSLKNETETEQMKLEMKALGKQIAMKDDEIAYLRNELSIMNQGLSKLAENLAAGNSNVRNIDSMITPVKEEITLLSGELYEMKERLASGSMQSYEKHIPIMVVGFLACLLIVYLIIMKW